MDTNAVGAGKAVGAEASQIAGQIARLDSAITDNSNLISELDTRLRAISRESCPSPDKATDTVEESLVPMAADIRQMRRAVAYHNERIRDILDRLEL